MSQRPNIQIPGGAENLPQKPATSVTFSLPQDQIRLDSNVVGAH